MTTTTTTAPTSEEAPVHLDDPIGILSVYVDADPALGGGPRPGWQAPVRAGLRGLARDAQHLPRAERLALEARLDELEPAIESLLDPRGSGRGRALFAGLDGGPVSRFDLRAPLPSLVHVGPFAVVLPLLAARQRDRAAGVVSISWTVLELFEWEHAELRPLETIELAPADEPRRGRPGTNPAVPQTFPERDRFETGVGARVANRVREAGAELRRRAEARGWDVVVADGDPRLLEALEQGLGAGAVPVVRQDGTVEETLARVRDEEEARLVARLDEAAAATHDEAVVERALAEGRVEHLLLPRVAGVDLHAEALLREALATSAEVTIVDIAAPAALLRW